MLPAPKTLDLLMFLTKHSNQLFSREELVEALWPGVYVDDHAARRGYCFLLDLAPALVPVVLVVPLTLITPETHYMQSGEYNITDEVSGSGPVDLVFVVGWVFHLEYFWREPHFAAFLRRLASSARLFLFDKTRHRVVGSDACEFVADAGGAHGRREGGDARGAFGTGSDSGSKRRRGGVRTVRRDVSRDDVGLSYDRLLRLEVAGHGLFLRADAGGAG